MSIINVISYNNEKYDIGVSWDNVTDKPQTYPPGVHQHSITDVQGLNDALNGKAASNHTHTSFVDGLTIGQLRYQDNRVANLGDTGNIDFLLGSYQYGYYLDRNQQNNTWQRILAINESGDDFIKFSNGYMICWGKRVWDATRSSGNRTFEFPKEFVSEPYVILTPLAIGYTAISSCFGISALSTTSFTTAIYGLGSSDRNTGASYIAIGKWK